MINASRTTSLIVSLSLLLVLTGVCVFEIYSIRSKNQEASILQSESEVGIRKESLAQSMRSLKNSARDELAELETFVINKAGIVSFIELLESIAHDMNLAIDISSVEAEKGEPTNVPQKVSISLEIEGGWDSNIRFIRAVENLPYPIKIENVNLYRTDVQSGGTQASTSNKWATRMTLNLFTYK